MSATEVPRILRSLVDLHGTQEAVAKRLGPQFSQPSISKWLNGVVPEGEPYSRIFEVAREDGILDGGQSKDIRSEDVAAELPEPPQTPKIKIVGYVGAGSRAHHYAVAEGEYQEIDRGPGDTNQTVAVEIRGKSMGPALEGWLVLYDNVRAPITDDMFGQLCVVGLTDDRILVKVVKRERNGSFSLLSNGPDEPIPDAKIEWAALVTDMRRRR